MERRSAPTRSSSEVLDPRDELEHAASFARSFDPEAAWTASRRAIEAAERIHDPSLLADAELAEGRFAEQERAFRESVEQRMKLHEQNEMRVVVHDDESAGAEPRPPREPGLIDRVVDRIRAAFSAPRRARTSS